MTHLPTSSEARDMHAEIAAQMNKTRIEAAVRTLVEYNHIREYEAYLKSKGKIGLHAIRSEQCRNHASPLAQWATDGRVSWRIRPSLGFLAAIGYAVADTMAVVEAVAEQDNQPTQH